MSRVILFDVDGTLVDSNYLHVLAWSRAFTDAGHDVPMWRLHGLIGQGSSRLVESVLGHGDDGVVDGHSRHYGEWIHTVRALPGAADLLRRTKRAGIDVVLATSASAEELETLRGVIDADDVIDHATSKDDADASKPAPDIVQAALAAGGYRAEDALLVGDAVWDVEAARRAGIDCVAVRSGGISAAELRDAGAIAVYDDAADLAAHFASSPLALRG